MRPYDTLSDEGLKMYAYMMKEGAMPLPPYIAARRAGALYDTVYDNGSVYDSLYDMFTDEHLRQAWEVESARFKSEARQGNLDRARSAYYALTAIDAELAKRGDPK